MSFRNKNQQRRDSVASESTATSFEAPTKMNNEHCQLKESDTVIAVMGATGTGKSTFVNQVAGRCATTVSDALSSCTREVKVVDCELNGRQIILIDTPGFDDTHLSDLDVLQLLADWLKNTYAEGVQLCGLLYFHRITDNRMAGSPRRLLDTFQNMCGKPAFRNVILTTTMWDEVDDEDAVDREAELCEKYWGEMIQSGARTARFLNTPTSAREVVSLVMPNLRLPLLIQTEMVDEKRQLPCTSAGKSLLGWLNELMRNIKKAMKDLRNKLKGTKKADILKKHNLKLKLDKLEKQQNDVRKIMTKYSGSDDTLVSFSSNSTSVGSPFDCLSPPPSPIIDKREACHNRQFLQSTITALKIIAELSGLAPFPGTRSVVGLALVIVECVEKSGVVNDALMELSRNASSLASSVAEVSHEKVTPAIQSCITYFIRELTDIGAVVKSMSSRNRASKFLLSTTDKERVDDCNRRLIFACSSLGAQVAVHNSISNARLEEKLDHVISLLGGHVNFPDPSHPAIATLAMRSNALLVPPHLQLQT